MPDRRLEVFHAAASQMSFTRAAELLQMTQPAVTFQIKQLEEHFGTRLFERAHGRVTLTPEGLKVKDYADRILDLFATLENELQEMASDLRGHLLIGATPTVAEYHADMGVINADGAKVYRYMNFDQIDEYAEAAKGVTA